MKTKLHTYRFDLKDPVQAAQYKAFRAERKAAGARLHRSHGSGSFCDQKDREVELETEHLFDNQWNTVDRQRVFDWAEDYQMHTPNIRRGHWLEITDEMRQARAARHACGWCGYQEDNPGYKFHMACQRRVHIPDPHHLGLLRMVPVDHRATRTDLTEQEAEELKTLQAQLQLFGPEPRIELHGRELDKAQKFAEAAIKKAQQRLAGAQFFQDRGISVANLIYYDHIGTYCFGWEGAGFPPHVAEAFQKALEGAPCRVEIKVAGTVPIVIEPMEGRA